MEHSEFRRPATRLRTEHLNNPLGVEARAPRLSWNIPCEKRGDRQTAYQIVAASTTAKLADDPDFWDSGQVESDECSLVQYRGSAIGSGRRVWWRVRYWDQNGQVSEWSENAFWEAGLWTSADWQARWLKLYRDRPEVNGRILPPCPFVRKAFSLDAPVVRARAYASARGVYKLFINGQSIGNCELAPGWTDYNRRIQYQTYDVTAALSAGENVVGAIVGDGWYSGYVGFNGQRDHYGREPELIIQLNIDLANGTRITVASDGTWKWSTGPIEYSDMLVGERYDSRNELTGWCTSDFDDSGWKPVHVHWRPPTSSPLVAQPDSPIRVTQELKPNRVDTRNGILIVDMGQNMVGRYRVRFKGSRGDVVRMRFAEVLSADGNLYVDNLRGARQTDEYVIRGNGVEVYEPLFTFHGFRYVEISGYDGDFDHNSIVGLVMESQTEAIGSLETGHAMVNQLVRNIDWGQRGNFLSIPTDCPQRDERLGWLGDAQVFVRTAAYNRDVAAFFTKWMTDVRDAQTAVGSFPNVAPLLVMDGDGAPAWGDAGVIVPWTMFLMYGDRRILEASYESIKRWISYIEEGNPDLIWRERSSYNFSDWLSIDAQTPADVLGTAYFAYDSMLASQIANILGKPDDVVRFQLLFDRIRAAFNREFVSPDGVITGETQTCYLLALHMNLLSEQHSRLAARYLVEDIERRGWHLSTGFVGVGYLCPTLSRIGRSDVAYTLLLNDTFPSWGYSIKNGATTIWERWDGWTEDKGFQDPVMNSFNHYSLGSVGEWLYRCAAGIDVTADGAGFRAFDLRPEVDERIGFLQACYLSPYGTIKSDWEVIDGTLTWFVSIPGNATATLYVPTGDVGSITEGDLPLSAVHDLSVIGEIDGRVILLAQSGSYRLKSKLPPARLLSLPDEGTVMTTDLETAKR